LYCAKEQKKLERDIQKKKNAQTSSASWPASAVG